MNELRDANRAYGEKLAELGAELPELVVLDADLAACSKTAPFIERFPGRHYNVGIQECNMVGVAAGMAACGKIPFVNSFGMFTAGRAYDQIRNAVVYPGLNVKVVGFYSGLSNGEDGPTHQCVEDLALMRAVPNMVVMCPRGRAHDRGRRKTQRALLHPHGPRPSGDGDGVRGLQV